ncbi:MAG: hypothetical protein Q8M31_06040 [Beijerinckiaceae bacterium]|nr:hypothetical protein [Beijerinckiaceae bacterium]
MTKEQNKPQSDAKDRDKNPDMDGNQGEGNRGAAKAYNDATADFAKSGKVDEQAQKARRDLEGDAGDELRRAEEEGKSHSKGEDPALRKG